MSAHKPLTDLLQRRMSVVLIISSVIKGLRRLNPRWAHLKKTKLLAQYYTSAPKHASAFLFYRFFGDHFVCFLPWNVLLSLPSGLNAGDTVFRSLCVCVCVCARAADRSIRRLKLRSSNLTSMFPGTVRTWPLKIFRKEGVARVTWPPNFLGAKC